MVIIRPKSSSAEDMKRLMACIVNHCQSIIENPRNPCTSMYLLELASTLDHKVGGHPPNVAVKGNLEWGIDSSVNLKFLEVFDVLGGRANLVKSLLLHLRQVKFKMKCTLTISVCRAAMASRDPFC